MEQNNQQTEQVAQANGQEEVVKTYTQEEFDKALNAEADRRFNKKRDSMRKDLEAELKGKWQKEYEAKLEAEKSEAERLANMTSEQRRQEELKKMQDSFDLEKAKFEEERKAFEQERMKLQLTKELSGLDVPIQFADFLLGQDAETTKNNLDSFVNAWNTLLQSKIEEHVQKALQGTPPKQSSNGSNQAMTKAEFVKLPYAERMKMMNENPDFVQQLLSQK